MCHYTSDNSSKKKSHSLTRKEILDSNIIDLEYLKQIQSFLLDPTGEGRIRMFQILDEYNFPKEFILEKIFTDISRMKIFWSHQRQSHLSSNREIR